jgi:hypothetical protein
MEDIIKLNSKGEENNYLKRLKKPNGEESKTYVLKVTTPQVRVGTTETKHKFIEPTGGPMSIEGFKCADIDSVIKSIDFTIGYGYSITFE